MDPRAIALGLAGADHGHPKLHLAAAFLRQAARCVAALRSALRSVPSARGAVLELLRSAFPFVPTIAARTHLSKATVGHALNELEQARLLTRVHRYSRRGEQKPRQHEHYCGYAHRGFG
jgi:DNA-binding transcriptional ArsR family regulator